MFLEPPDRQDANGRGLWISSTGCQTCAIRDFGSISMWLTADFPFDLAQGRLRLYCAPAPRLDLEGFWARSPTSFVLTQTSGYKRESQKRTGVSAPHWLLVFCFGDYFQLEGLVVAFGYVQRGALGFVGLEEIRVEIGFAVYALPGEDGVVTGGKAV